MPRHKVELDDLIHRSLMVNTELSTDTDFSVKVVYKKSPSGNFINYLVIKSLVHPKVFGDLDIPTDGFKIPPDVDSLKLDESKDNYQTNLQS